ncbi:diacylglycerol/lipid kinase family protein [Dictyobacter formicarum]|nr:diacylglycerol kinase family protein [Dictyobacter formicarum]
MQQKAIVIHSPGSGRSSKLGEAIEWLRLAGMEFVDVLPISALDGLPPQGPVWQKQGIQLAIAAGGDGLVGGVTSHIVSSGLPLGILPLGTANDVARTLGISMDIEQAAATIMQGKATSIDIGVAQPAEQEPHHISDPHKPVLPTDAQSYFVHALTIGINVKFAKFATDKQLRKKYGNLTYAAAVAKALQSYTPIEVDLDFEGVAIYDQGVNGKPGEEPRILNKTVHVSSKVAQVTIVNSPVFWGALRASVPGVNLHDRLLDIVIIEADHLANLVYKILRFFRRSTIQKADYAGWYKQFPELFSAERSHIPGIHHIQAQGITIHCRGQQAEATLDGEIRGQTPIHARVANECLNVIVP